MGSDGADDSQPGFCVRERLATRPTRVSGEELLMLRVKRSKYVAGAVAAFRHSAGPPQRLPAVYSIASSSYDQKWRFLHNRPPEQNTSRFELFDSYVKRSVPP